MTELDEFIMNVKETINRYLSLLQVTKELECEKLGQFSIKCTVEVKETIEEKERELYGERADGLKAKVLLVRQNAGTRITFYFWKER